VRKTEELESTKPAKKRKVVTGKCFILDEATTSGKGNNVEEVESDEDGLD